ncbi:unnamed protein product, partial [Symbiodinium sp. CCMP2456]
CLVPTSACSRASPSQRRACPAGAIGRCGDRATEAHGRGSVSRAPQASKRGRVGAEEAGSQ